MENILGFDASPTLVDKANGVSRWSLNLVRISQWSQLHLHIAVVAVVLSILLRRCCRHLKFVEVSEKIQWMILQICGWHLNRLLTTREAAGVAGKTPC